MIKKRITYILIALNLIVPIFFAMASVEGSWLPGTRITLNGVIDDIQPSIEFNERNGTVAYSYTYYLPAEGTSDIYLSNNSANTGYDAKTGYLYDEMGAIVMDDENIDVITNTNYDPTQSFIVTSMNNTNSDVGVAGWSNETWVVWEGRDVALSDKEIFVYYRRGTTRWVQMITSDSDEDIKPKVVAFNDSYAVVAWLSGSNLNYVNIDGESIGLIRTLGSSVTEFDLVRSGVPGSEYAHLLYLDGSNIQYDIKMDGTIIFPSVTTVHTSAGCSGLTLDAEGDYVGFALSESDGDIYHEISDDLGATFTVSTGVAISAGARTLSDPEIYITNYGKMEIFYVDTFSVDFYDIYSIDNFAGSWSAEDPLFRTRTSGGYRYFDPTVAYWNGTVVGLYDHTYHLGSGWVDVGADLYLFGYLNFYDDGTNYNYFEIVNEAPPPYYLIEGLNLVYNGTGTDLDLNITLTDTITLESYTNITTIDGNGGQQRYVFFDPDKYMLTNNPYDLTIRWDVPGSEVLHIPFDPTILADYLDENETVLDYYEYNITSNDYPEGFNPVYDLGTDNIVGPQIGISLEVGTGRFTKTEEGIHPGVFSDTNYADFGIINMVNEERYNFTFTTSNSNFKAYLFNDSVQTLNPLDAIRVFDSTQTYYDFYCDKTDNYFVLIQNEDYSSSGTFSFQYELCPRNVTLQTPWTGTYFNWDDTTQIELKWRKYTSDLDIGTYIIQVSNNSQFENSTGGVTEYGPFNAALQTTMNFTGDRDIWYYWRARAIDTAGNEGYFDDEWRFAFDEEHPTQPIINAPEPVITEKTFEINWKASTDGVFPIAYYNVYRSTSPDFTPGPATMITNEGFIHTNYTDIVTRNDRYYYIIEAVDNVGHTSLMSPIQTYTVSYGGTVDANDQKFQVLVGDIVEYEVSWIVSENQDIFRNPFMTFREKEFQMGTRFHFWIKDIDKRDVLPVRGDWYSLASNTSYQDTYKLEEEDLYLQPFITNNNATYQRDVFDLWVTQNLPYFTLGENMNVTNYTSTWSDGVYQRNVRAFTYFEAPDDDYSQSSVTFVVDVDTGILVEMTYYDRHSDYGYALKLVDTSSELSISDWTYGPFIIPGIIISVAAIIYAIMKKVEL